jgi:hypothetical protein
MSARRVFAVALPVLFVMQAAAPAAAQDVRAEVQIRTGPVQGRIIVGGDARRPIERERVVVVERRRHAGERIVIERRNPRRVRIVEDFRTSTQRAHGRHDNRHIVAWWDPRNDDYGFQRWRSGLHRVLLCEHGDKLYVLSDQYDRGRFDRHDDDRRYDRDDRDRRFDRDGRHDR